MHILAYAVYDCETGELHQFTAEATILAKDVVSAFVTDKVMDIHWAEDAKKDFLTALSGTKDIEDLKSCMAAYELTLAIMPINCNQPV